MKKFFRSLLSISIAGCLCTIGISLISMSSYGQSAELQQYYCCADASFTATTNSCLTTHTCSIVVTHASGCSNTCSTGSTTPCSTSTVKTGIVEDTYYATCSPNGACMQGSIKSTDPDGGGTLCSWTAKG
jgi:hypothetical protein